MESFFNYRNLLSLIWKWKYHLAALVILAAVLSAFFSSRLFITPLFKSTAIAYPGNISPYSDESETEQMIQILNSGDIRDSVIGKFQLGRHYGLDTNDKYYLSTLYYLYGKRVSVKKTEFESVQIEVLDSDPKKACDMVNAILDLFNRKVNRMHKMKFYEVFLNYKEVLAQKEKQLDSIRNAIDQLGKNSPVLSTSIQLQEFSKNMITKKDKDRGIEINKPLFEKTKSSLGNQGGDLVMLLSLAQSEAEGYSEFKLLYDEALLNYNREYTHLNLVSKPYPADKKSSPRTWLIFIMSVTATLILSLVLISIVENRRSVKQDVRLP